MPCRTVIFAGDSVFVRASISQLTASLRPLIFDNVLGEQGYVSRCAD